MSKVLRQIDALKELIESAEKPVRESRSRRVRVDRPQEEGVMHGVMSRTKKKRDDSKRRPRREELETEGVMHGVMSRTKKKAAPSKRKPRRESLARRGDAKQYLSEDALSDLFNLFYPEYGRKFRPLVDKVSSMLEWGVDGAMFFCLMLLEDVNAHAEAKQVARVFHKSVVISGGSDEFEAVEPRSRDRAVDEVLMHQIMKKKGEKDKKKRR